MSGTSSCRSRSLISSTLPGASLSKARSVGKPRQNTIKPMPMYAPRHPNWTSIRPAAMGMKVDPMPLPNPAATPSISPRFSSNHSDMTLE